MAKEAVEAFGQFGVNTLIPISLAERKDKTINFPFVAKVEGVLHFEGMAFRPESKDAVTLYVAKRRRRSRGSVPVHARSEIRRSQS